MRRPSNFRRGVLTLRGRYLTSFRRSAAISAVWRKPAPTTQRISSLLVSESFNSNSNRNSSISRRVATSASPCASLNASVMATAWLSPSPDSLRRVTNLRVSNVMLDILNCIEISRCCQQVYSTAGSHNSIGLSSYHSAMHYATIPTSGSCGSL